MKPDEAQSLLAKLTHTPVEAARLVAGLPESAIAVRATPDEFSVLENICHLRDIEVEGYTVRIQSILSEDHPTLVDLDGARLAAERNYNKQDLDEALAAFTLARRRNVAVLSRASDIQFEREGNLQGVGTISLGRLVQMMCDHDEEHVEELRITRKRLLRAHQA